MARHGFGSSVVLVLLLVTTFVQPWSTSPSIASTDIIATFEEKIGFSVWLASSWCFGGLNISSTNNCWHSSDNELLSSLNKCCDSNNNELLTFIVAVRTMFFFVFSSNLITVNRLPFNKTSNSLLSLCFLCSLANVMPILSLLQRLRLTIKMTQFERNFSPVGYKLLDHAHTCRQRGGSSAVQRLACC